jgi:hypothetical protein
MGDIILISALANIQPAAVPIGMDGIHNNTASIMITSLSCLPEMPILLSSPY